MSERKWTIAEEAAVFRELKPVQLVRDYASDIYSLERRTVEIVRLVLDAREALAWEVALKKALLESQERLAGEVKDARAERDQAVAVAKRLGAMVDSVLCGKEINVKDRADLVGYVESLEP